MFGATSSFNPNTHIFGKVTLTFLVLYDVCKAFCNIGRFVPLSILLHWAFCRIGHFVIGRFVLAFCNIGRFVNGRFVPTKENRIYIRGEFSTSLGKNFL